MLRRTMLHLSAAATLNCDFFRPTGTALDRIKQAETTLIANPGSFDDIMKPITDSLTTAISNEKTLVSVVEEIFKQVTIARISFGRTTNFKISFACE